MRLLYLYTQYNSIWTMCLSALNHLEFNRVHLHNIPTHAAHTAAVRVYATLCSMLISLAILSELKIMSVS